jgi:hypothetical protein
MRSIKTEIKSSSIQNIKHHNDMNQTEPLSLTVITNIQFPAIAENNVKHASVYLGQYVHQK